MSKKPRGGSRQPELIPRSMAPKIPIDAAIACLGRGDDSQGDAGCDVARVGGPYPSLRPSALRVWIDGDGLEPGLHDIERLRGADGRRRDEAHQRICSEVGGRGEVSGSERGGGGHDSAGGAIIRRNETEEPNVDRLDDHAPELPDTL